MPSGNAPPASRRRSPISPRRSSTCRPTISRRSPSSFSPAAAKTKAWSNSPTTRSSPPTSRIASTPASRQSILDNNEPSPDFKVDWKALEARYLPTIAAPPLDLRDRPEITAIKDNYTTAVSRKSAHSRVGKEIDAEVEERKAQLKSVLGNHASAILSDGSSVAFKQINVKEQRRPPSSYQRIDIQPAGGQLN